MLIPIDAIVVEPGHRQIRADDLKQIIVSIQTIGLKTPITVRPGKRPGTFILVAGRHRLEAYKRLGRAEIEAVLEADAQLHARLWETAENLHRADLTALQRAVWQGKWVKLVAEKIKRDQKDKLRQDDAVSPGGRGHKGGVRAAAEKLGIPEKTARRSVTIATHLTKAAQKEAQKLGLDDNLKALERAAGVGSAEEQIQALHRTFKGQQQKAETKAKIAENLTGASTPRTAQEAFECWFESLDIDMQMKVRIWHLGLDVEAYYAERDKTAKLLREDRAALH
jgi:ParB-like chromosome segregation protein Spo0J